MKNYILRVNLPDLKAGAVFEPIKKGEFYQCGGVRYGKSIVESQSKFFRKETIFDILLKII